MGWDENKRCVVFLTCAPHPKSPARIPKFRYSFGQGSPQGEGLLFYLSLRKRVLFPFSLGRRGQGMRGNTSGSDESLYPLKIAPPSNEYPLQNLALHSVSRNFTPKTTINQTKQL